MHKYCACIPRIPCLRIDEQQVTDRKICGNNNIDIYMQIFEPSPRYKK